MPNDLKKYRHIIWDFNGTLFDDSWLCVEILNDLLRKRDLPLITSELYARIFDIPVVDFYEKIGFDFSIEPFDIVGTEFITEYNRRRYECKFQPDVLTALKTFADNGLTQSVLSAYQHEHLVEIIDHLKISHFFTKILGLNDHYVAGKTDNAKLLVKDLSCSPGQVLVLGDMTHDYDVAKTIGADCILIPGGHQDLKQLQTCPTTILESISQLLKLLN